MAKKALSKSVSFRDPKAPIDARVQDLIRQLTVKEKIGFLCHKTPGVKRLGIAPYVWWNECLHGVGRAGRAGQSKGSGVFSKTPDPFDLHESRLFPESGEIDLESLATEAGVSSRTFRRQFKQRMGLSPRAYILGQRINRAKQLLTDTTLPIKQIAIQLGYSDVYFFTRQFREQTGLPPALYRRSREH